MLFVYQVMLSFVEKDLRILKPKYKVLPFQFSNIISILSLFFAVSKCDVTFSWFGKFHAFWAVFFSKLLGKKSVVIAGGDDVAHVPGIKYGMFVYWWKKWCPLFVFKHADIILAVSHYNLRETIKNAKANPAKVKLLYHGFDVEKWRRVCGVSKERLVLTVGRITDETVRKKGLDLFVRSAAYLADVPFVLVGPWDNNAVNQLRVIAPPNVSFTGGLYGEELVHIYSQAKVYVQVSIHESFGCSLAEAMLCECIPVVSRRAAIPEVVGETGFYVDKIEPKEVANKIKKALMMPDNYAEKARRRIAVKFSLEKRENQISNYLNILSNET